MFILEYLKTVYIICSITLLALNFGLGVNIKLTNLKCNAVDQKLGEFKMCSLKAVKRDLVELSIHYGVTMDVIDNASLLMRFKKRGTSDQKALYQYKVDMCAFLRNTRRNPLADLFYAIFEFRKYSNINHSCPYDHDIIMKGCRINTKMLSVLPISSGEYTIFTNWYLQGKLACNVDVSITVY